MDKDNISQFRDCYGCGVCAIICPKQIISISLNKEGFYQPNISEEGNCVNCGLCLEVCAFNHDNISLKESFLHSYAGWSNDELVRKKCSSGGIAFELAKTLLAQGYKICGVRYNIKHQRAEHYISTTIEELTQSIGSKYIQSYTLDAFKEINREDKYLVSGTPCQIDSFRRLIKKRRIEDNFILMDFFCHGVPSMLLWNKYIRQVEKLTGPVSYVSWRNKNTGWHDSYNLSIREKKGFYNSRLSQGDLFFKFFLSNTCLGKACYKHCKYKYVCSSADIRIGDLWGHMYEKDEKGVSAVITFTKKGAEALSLCPSTLIEHPLEIVTEGQIKKKIKKPLFYPIISFLLKSPLSLNCYLFKIALFSNRALSFLFRMKNNILTVIK